MFLYIPVWTVRNVSASCCGLQKRTRKFWSASTCASLSTVYSSGLRTGRRTRDSWTTSQHSPRTGGLWRYVLTTVNPCYGSCQPDHQVFIIWWVIIASSEQIFILYHFASQLHSCDPSVKAFFFMTVHAAVCKSCFEFSQQSIQYQLFHYVPAAMCQQKLQLLTSCGTNSLHSASNPRVIHPTFIFTPRKEYFAHPLIPKFYVLHCLVESASGYWAFFSPATPASWNSLPAVAGHSRILFSFQWHLKGMPILSIFNFRLSLNQ